MSRSNLIRFFGLAAIWGSGFLWIKFALRGFDPVQIVLIRLVLGAVVLAPMAWRRRRPKPGGPRMWLHLFVAAFLANALPYTLFGIGEQTVGSSVAGLLNATTPLWTLVAGIAVGGDRSIDLRRAGAMVLGLTGVVTILTPWHSAGHIVTAGGLVCLTASASYGVSYIYMGRFLGRTGLSAVSLSAAQLAAGAVLMAAVVPVAGRSVPHLRLDAVLGLLILGTLGTGVAYVLNYRLIVDEGPGVASIITYLLPVVAVVLGAAVMREPLSLSMFAGAALVLAGVAVVQLRPSPVPAGPAQPPTLEPVIDPDAGGSDLKQTKVNYFVGR
jgi:drug/metabolite transporter (DMT)-like permease